MMAGGIANGHGSVEYVKQNLPAQCRYTTTITRTWDFNLDGQRDEVSLRTPDFAGCPFTQSNRYISLKRGKDYFSLMEVTRSRYFANRFSPNLKQFSFSKNNIPVSAKKGGAAFKMDDRVEVPFGPHSNQPLTGRIQGFIFEVDSYCQPVRTLAEVTYGNVIDYFELSALKLVGY